MINFVNGALIVSIAWAVGSFSSKVVEGNYLQVPVRKERILENKRIIQNRRKSFSEFNSIIEMNVFDVAVMKKNGSSKLDQEKTDKPISNSLTKILNNLELKGITSGIYNFATIYDKKSNKEDVLGLDDKIFDTKAKVVRIITDEKPIRVLIKLDGEIGSLLLNPESQNGKNNKTRATNSRSTQSTTRTSRTKTSSSHNSSSSSSTAYTKNGEDYFISSAEIDNELDHLGNLLNQARVVPHLVDGVMTGYQVEAIDKGSLYDRLGFKLNDVIKHINGEALDTPEKAMRLLNAFRNEREFSINIVRGGESKTLSYHIN
jgi:type II secretion system protein C